MSTPVLYIPSYLSIARHPKTKKLHRLLGDRLIATTIGRLHLFWHWAMEFAPDGDVTDFLEDVAEAMELGFDEGSIDLAPRALDLLEEARFLDRVGDRRLIHDWRDYAGKVLVDRAADAARKRADREADRASRMSDGCPPDAPAVPSGRPPDVRRTSDQCPPHNREETRGEETRTEGGPGGPPPAPNGAELSLGTKPRRRPRRSPQPDEPEGFAEFYSGHPRRENRPAALKAYRKLNPDPELRAKIMAGQRIYANRMLGHEREGIATPGPWLNGRRWEDEINQEGTSRSPIAGQGSAPVDPEVVARVKATIASVRTRTMPESKVKE